MKIILFPQAKDLLSFKLSNFDEPLKFHPIVYAEVTRWLTDFARKGRNRKVKKFGKDLIIKAQGIAKSHKQSFPSTGQTEINYAYSMYRGKAALIKSNSAPPSDEDLRLLYDADYFECGLVTNDDIMFKLGKQVIGARCHSIEEVLKDFLKQGFITKDEIEAFEKNLLLYDETINLTLIFK